MDAGLIPSVSMGFWLPQRAAFIGLWRLARVVDLVTCDRWGGASSTSYAALEFFCEREFKKIFYLALYPLKRGERRVTCHTEVVFELRPGGKSGDV